MEVIKSVYNSSRNAYTLKILETPKYLILNDQLYDKSDLNPIPFEILDNNDITFTSWIFILKRFIFCNYRNENRYYEQLVKEKNYGMVEDFLYPGRFYVTGQRQTTGGYLKVLEESINPSSGKTIIKSLKEWNNGESATNDECRGHRVWYHSGNFNIIHQDKDYLIVEQNWPEWWRTSTWWDATGNRCNIFKINKSDLSTSTIHDPGRLGGDASYNYFYMEHVYAFDYIFINWHLNHYILKYDALHNSSSTIYDNAEAGCDITCNPVKIGDYFYYLVDEYKRTGHYAYQLCKVKINYEQSNCSYEYLDIENKELMDIDGSAVMANITHPLIHECHSIITEDNQYLIVIARSQPNGEWYSPQHKIVVLRIEEDKAVVTDVINLKDKPCRGVLSYYEEDGHADVLITLHTPCFMIWKFDYEQEKYVNTFIQDGTFYSIGLDEQLRLYVQDTNNTIQMFDKIESSTVKVYFKEKNVDENAETTTLCFWAKNYFNEFVKESVTINLYNGITFEDGSIQKDFETSPAGPIEITVLITTTDIVRAQATIAVTSR